MLMTANSSEHSLTVEVSNVSANKGNLYLAFWDSKSSFLDKDNTTLVKVAEGDAKTVKVTLPSVKKGWWAMAILQDENGNKKMDYNFFGIPIENFGFSNNPKIFMAEPSFEECKFYLQSDTTIHVKID